MIMKRRYAFLLALVIAALALGERGGGKGGKGVSLNCAIFPRPSPQPRHYPVYASA
jgi:hypothetical protein